MVIFSNLTVILHLFLINYAFAKHPIAGKISGTVASKTARQIKARGVGMTIVLVCSTLTRGRQKKFKNLFENVPKKIQKIVGQRLSTPVHSSMLSHTYPRSFCEAYPSFFSESSKIMGKVDIENNIEKSKPIV